MAYHEHDDAAYAADIEDPTPSASSIPTAASFRRQRSPRNRDFGLYAGRLRQQHPPTKHDDAASDVEPLDYVEGQSTANSSPPYALAHSRDNGGSMTSKASRTTGRALLGSPRPQTAKARTKFDFDDSYDEVFDDDDIDSSIDRDLADSIASPQLSSFPQSPTSPISPRWASLANSTAVYSYASSSNATVSVPVSSLHTSVTSAGFSTAPTSPISPSSSTIAAKSLFRSPSTTSSRAAQFAALSSNPFVDGDSTPERNSSSTEDSALAAEKRAEPYQLTDFTPILPPPPPPRSDLRSPTPPLSGQPSAMIVGNFSRPRQASIKQGFRDALPALGPSTTTVATTTRIRLPEPLQLETSSPAVSSKASSTTSSTTSSATQQAWPRERARGLSISSNKSSSTHSSIVQTNDRLKLGQLVPSSSTPNDVVISPGLPRPPVAYSRTDSTGSNTTGTAALTFTTTARNLPQPRDPLNLSTPADEEDPSCQRSQWASSAAQKSMFSGAGVARSSILAKGSSRASLAWFNSAGGSADDGLSVDDVMGMYEKGFDDSTGAEDNEEPYGSATAQDSGDEELTDEESPRGNLTPSGHHHNTLGSGMIGSKILEAMSDPLPVPSRVKDPTTSSDDAALDTPRTIRYSGLSSSVPKESGFALATQHMNNGQLAVPLESDREGPKEKRDSAKMLESEDNAQGRASPLPSPQLMTPLGSRPGSAKTPSLFARAQNESEEPGARDRYGFRKHNQYITREQYDAWNGPYTEYLGRRRRKWVAYLRDSGMITDKPTRFPPPSVKTKRFIRKGIPPEWRGAAWFYYAGGPSIVAKHPGIYSQLIARAARGEAKEVDVESIERDLHRTFPDNVAFQFSGDHQPGHTETAQPDEGTASAKATIDITANRADEPKIVSKLRRVLLAFSIYNPRIGYCQSLNFLAGLLLLFVQTEEHCFWLLNVITRIFLPGTHEMSLEGSKVDLGVLMAAMQESLPSVWAKIGGDLEDVSPSTNTQNAASRDLPRHGTIGRKMKLPKVGGSKASDALTAASADRLPPITLCMTAWFMSCFIGTLPIETTLRVWDIFFYEGSKTLFRVALAIFKLGESEIRAVTDPMEMFGVVQGLPRRILDSNMLMETTFRRRNGFGHLSQESIEEKRKERRDAFQEARDDALAANTSSTNPTAVATVMAGGLGAALNSGQGEAARSATVRRKGTLFGRRRDRRPAEVA